MPAPGIVFHNRQRALRCNTRAVRQGAARALPLCLATPGPGDAVLASLAVIEVSLLSDRRIAAVHGRFLADPSPTDVITFPYGEILLGAGTIAANARAAGHTLEREVLLCVIHGLLHLNGHRDKAAREAAAMAARQEEILKAVEPGLW